MNITTHLILVSAQAVPNITPVLDESFKPRQVILLVSPDMGKRAAWLEKVMNKRGIKTARWTIDDPWDIEHIRDRVLDLMSEHQDGTLALNATGGTKPMSIAAYEAFRELEQPIFYVHPEQDRIIWMYPLHRPGQLLADRIKLPEFFQAYGATVNKQGDPLGVPAAYRALTDEIVSRVGYFEKPLSALNYWAAQAINRLSVILNDRAVNDGPLQELIDLFASAEVLALEKNRLTFKDEDARFFVNGGWLEQHVYGLCLNLKKRCSIQDIGRSIEVERMHGNLPVRNEIDVAFLKDNRLHMIECKTKIYADKHPVHSEGAQTLYKLDTLKDLLGGLQARAMLVSFTRPKLHDLQRAGDLNISVCYHTDLSLLKEKLETWIR